jgi:hypothetical protein
MSITEQVKKINDIYRKMSESYYRLKVMFKNHKLILGKIELSEKMFHEALITIANKTEEIVVKKEFQKIIKSIKKEDK